MLRPGTVKIKLIASALTHRGLQYFIVPMYTTGRRISHLLLFLLITTAIVAPLVIEHKQKQRAAEEKNRAQIPSVIRIVSGDTLAKVMAIGAAISYILLFAALTGIEDWERPGGLGAALAFGCLTAPAIPILTMRSIKIKRLIRSGERKPYFFIEREYEALPTFGYLHNGTLYKSSVEPSDNAAGILPPTAVFDPNKPDKPIILENFLPRGVRRATEGSFVTTAKIVHLFSAIKSDDLTAIESVTAEAQYLEIEDYMGRTPLMVAAETGKTKSGETLLSRGARVDGTNFRGVTPFMVACEKGHVEVARLLLERGANANAARDNGETPLISASRHGHSEIVRLLMEQRAILDQEDANGITALMRALNQNHRDIVKQLIAGGADVTKKPESGITPLVIAIRNGDAEIVRLLLEKGASPSEKVNILVKDDEFSDLRQLIGLGKRIGVVEVGRLASA